MAQEGGVEDVYFSSMYPNKTSEIFSVNSEELRKVALERGYIEFHSVHLTDIASVPRIRGDGSCG